MTSYTAHFDFTTVHGGSRFVGRTGQADFSTEASLEQCYKDIEEIKLICVTAIKAHNPKWNVFMITVKEIVVTPPSSLTDKK